MTGMKPEPRLLVDSTAARLSRWLRFLGLDVVLDRSKSAAHLLLRARKEGRVLLTRRRNLRGNTAAAVVVLESDHLLEQLEQVISALSIPVTCPPRCTVCNGELIIVPRVNADGRVPEFVYRTQTEFAFCEQCDRYYWKGTHLKNIHEASRPLLRKSGEAREPSQRREPAKSPRSGKPVEDR